jgi:CPA2 family monovalent cation:H+ antiporter-2
MLGILLVQDLSVVPIIVAIQAVTGSVQSLWLSIVIAMAKAVGFIALMLTLGYWGMPWFLKKVAAARSREIFLLTVVVICLERTYIFSHIGLVIAIIIGIIFIKFLITSAITRLFGYSHKTVLMVGTGLINVGEFGFILALMGLSANIFTNDIYNLIVAAAILTMFLTPFAMSLNSYMYRRLSQTKFFARQLISGADQGEAVREISLSHHAVICGYGTVGRRIAEVMERQKFAYLVIELDPMIISELNTLGIPCIYGDASNPEILAHAYLDKARVLVCTIPDYVATALTARNALRINPKLDIVARVHQDTDAELLKGIGVTELVLPFFEGSLEMIRHTLHRFGMSSTEIQYILNNLRNAQTERQGRQ